MSKLIAIVGPTASGKTELGLQLATELDGEIICADSRTIYRGMDVGTAKPSLAEQAEVPHHLLDIREPYESYSAAEFKDRAQEMIQDILARDKLPIMVGGTGLYAYGVLYDYTFPAGPANELRDMLNEMPLVELVAWLKREDPERAADIDLANPRRVIRAIETLGQPIAKSPRLRPDTLLLGMRLGNNDLQERIESRTKEMFDQGLVEEVKVLMHEFGSDVEALRSPGYAEVLELLSGTINESACAAQINLHTRQLVKRQLTWFRRNKDIAWYDSPAKAMAAAKEFVLGDPELDSRSILSNQEDPPIKSKDDSYHV